MKYDGPKILFWDIESTNLNADFGVMLMVGYKWAHDEKVHLIRIDKTKPWIKCKLDDSEVVKQFLKVISAADMQVTWYGKRFDEPFLRARMLFHGYDRDFPPVPHVDLWETARYQLKLSSNRLARIQDFLELPDEKTPLTGRQWLAAAGGDKGALGYIAEHCEADVKVLEEAYYRLRPFIRKNRPNLAQLYNDGDACLRCPTCESTRVVKQGVRLTIAGKFQRWQCQACGSWSSSPLKGKRAGYLR